MAHFWSRRDIRHSHETALLEYSLLQRTRIKCATHSHPIVSNILALFTSPGGPDWLVGTRSRHHLNARVQMPWSLDQRNTLSSSGSGLGTSGPSFTQES